VNKKIKELIEQADDYTDNYLCTLREFQRPDWHIVRDEKFAELIVRECAKVCRDQFDIYAMKADRDNCAIAIEQHFGVEE
jgi:hypothetical protein